MDETNYKPTAAEYNRKLPKPGAYANGWRELLALPDHAAVTVPGAIVGMPGWGRQSTTAGEAKRRCLAALDSRINARAGFVPRDSRENVGSMFRDADRLKDINTRRVRVYQFETRAVYKRFAHLLARHDD